MTMYDELVKDLRYLAKVYSICENENTKEYKLAVEAADAIEGAWNDGYKKGLDDAAEVDLVKKMSYWWIPVTERLPEKNGWYLTFVCNKWQGSLSDQTVSIWDGERFHVSSFAIVTHWMPLPHSPESEGE